MSFENPKNLIVGVKAGEDLRTHQYKFVVLDSSGDVILNVVAGAAVDGVLQDTVMSGEAAPVAPSGTSKVVAGAAVTAGDKVMSNSLGKAITATSNATSASKAGGAETYDLAPGDAFILDVDNIGNATSTFDAAAGSVTDTTTYAVADQDGLTSIITIDGGDAQTVTFSGATTTAASVALQMNDQLVDCSVAVVGGQVVVESDTKGTDSTVVAAAGTGGLTWDTPVAGTGDVANINAVTAAEVETVVEADTTATVVVVAGVFTISSPTTGATSELEFVSGTALIPLGLTAEVITGADSDSYYVGKAQTSAAAEDELISVLLDNEGKA